MKLTKPNLAKAICGLAITLIACFAFASPVTAQDSKSKSSKTAKDESAKESTEDSQGETSEEVEPAEVPDNSEILARHKSLFEPRPGADPFFPQRRIASDPKKETKPVASANVYDRISVKGISGSASKRVAIINNKNVETGDTALISTAGGPVSIKIIEIKENSVVIKAESASEPKELFLRRF